MVPPCGFLARGRTSADRKPAPAARNWASGARRSRLHMQLGFAGQVMHMSLGDYKTLERMRIQCACGVAPASAGGQVQPAYNSRRSSRGQQPSTGAGPSQPMRLERHTTVAAVVQ